MFGFEPIEYDEPRQLRKKLPITEPTLKGVSLLILVALLFIGPVVGRPMVILTLALVLACVIGFGIMRNWDRSGLFLGNYAAREAAEEENRRQFEAQMQSKSIEVTEAEIDDIEVIMQFAEGETHDEAPEAGESSKWRWVSLPLIWFLMLWPIYFWPRYFWQYLYQYPSKDATDRAEDWMWWWLFVSIPSFMFLAWQSAGSTLPFWSVLLSYGLSGVALWWVLTLRRNTDT